jgi:hypothetical protein
MNLYNKDNLFFMFYLLLYNYWLRGKDSKGVNNSNLHGPTVKEVA